MKGKRILSAALALTTMAAACAVGVASASEAEPQVEWNIPHSIKIGEGIKNPAFGSNLPVKGQMNEYGYWRSDYFARITPWDNSNNNLFPEDGGYPPHAAAESEVMQDGTAQIATGDYQPVYPFRPGTVTYQFQVYEYDEESGQENIIMEVGEPYTLTVEEPVIQTNAPAYAQSGSTIDLTTALTNTALKDEKVAPYLDEENYWIHGRDGALEWLYLAADGRSNHAPAFAPSVEVIEGADLVQRTEQDYSNTLTSSEKLTFTGTGTVKLKVTYHQILVCTMVDRNEEIYATEFNPLMDFKESYSPEQIITIQVTEDGKAPADGTGSDSNGAPGAGGLGDNAAGKDFSVSPNTGDGSFILSIGALAVSGAAVPVLLTRKKKHQ